MGGKNANRSTPCILVQNLSLREKDLSSSCCFLSSHQMLGRGALAGGGPRLLFLSGEGR